jgi:hypothetical protein
MAKDIDHDGARTHDLLMYSFVVRRLAIGPRGLACEKRLMFSTEIRRSTLPHNRLLIWPSSPAEDWVPRVALDAQPSVVEGVCLIVCCSAGCPQSFAQDLLASASLTLSFLLTNFVCVRGAGGCDSLPL